jgi:hypothetical protein
MKNSHLADATSTHHDHEYLLTASEVIIKSVEETNMKTDPKRLQFKDVISGKESADPELVWSLAWQYQRDHVHERLQRNTFCDNNAFSGNTPPNECGCKLVRAAAHRASDPLPSIMDSTDELLP